MKSTGTKQIYKKERKKRIFDIAMIIVILIGFAGTVIMFTLINIDRKKTLGEELEIAYNKIFEDVTRQEDYTYLYDSYYMKQNSESSLESRNIDIEEFKFTPVSKDIEPLQINDAKVLAQQMHSIDEETLYYAFKFIQNEKETFSSGKINKEEWIENEIEKKINFNDDLVNQEFLYELAVFQDPFVSFALTNDIFNKLKSVIYNDTYLLENLEYSYNIMRNRKDTFEIGDFSKVLRSISLEFDEFSFNKEIDHLDNNFLQRNILSKMLFYNQHNCEDGFLMKVFFDVEDEPLAFLYECDGAILKIYFDETDDLRNKTVFSYEDDDMNFIYTINSKDEKYLGHEKIVMNYSAKNDSSSINALDVSIDRSYTKNKTRSDIDQEMKVCLKSKENEITVSVEGIDALYQYDRGDKYTKKISQSISIDIPSYTNIDFKYSDKKESFFNDLKGKTIEDLEDSVMTMKNEKRKKESVISQILRFFCSIF